MSAYTGDEIYFHHQGTPRSGKVVATGRHGCTVEHGGKHHKVKWEQVAGHKKRAEQRYQVVEEGEDGVIVMDASGKRRLVSIPKEARAEQVAMGPNKKARTPR